MNPPVLCSLIFWIEELLEVATGSIFAHSPILRTAGGSHRFYIRSFPGLKNCWGYPPVIYSLIPRFEEELGIVTRPMFAFFLVSSITRRPDRLLVHSFAGLMQS